MQTRKTAKYFKYAIGEIVLVVIGILIALSLNNWNESRKQTNYELHLLGQLKKDFERNANDLRTNISLQYKSIESCDLLIAHLEQYNIYNDTLLAHFANSGIWTKFIVNAGAYKTIESKGLDMITNLELRDLVFRIYQGNLNWLKQMESTVINQAENFRINKASNYFKEWNAITVINGKYKTGNVEIIDYSNLLESNEVLYYLKSFSNSNKILLEISQGYLDDNMQGISLIDSLLE